MASEALKLTARIVMSHASMTELTKQELVKEIQEVYSVLSSLESGAEVPVAKGAAVKSRKTRKRKMVESPEAKAVETEGPVLWTPDYMDFMSSREG